MLTWWIMATIKSITFAVPNEESVLKKKRVLSPAHQIKYNNSNNKKPEATKSNEKKRSKCSSNFPLSMDCAHVTSAATMTIKMNTIERRFSIVTKAFSISSHWMMSVRCDWLRLDHCVGFGFIAEGGHIVHWVFHLMLFYLEIDTFNRQGIDEPFTNISMHIRIILSSK